MSNPLEHIPQPKLDTMIEQAGIRARQWAEYEQVLLQEKIRRLGGVALERSGDDQSH